MVNSSAPTCTTSPASTCRSLTMPSNGAPHPGVLQLLRAAASRARASSSAPSALVALSRACLQVPLRHRARLLQPLRALQVALGHLEGGLRAPHRRAGRQDASLDRASSSVASTAPRFTRSPASAQVRSIRPATSARTVRPAPARASPRWSGPLRSSVSAATAMFSAPTVTTGSLAGVALAFSSLRQRDQASRRGGHERVPASLPGAPVRSYVVRMPAACAARVRHSA